METKNKDFYINIRIDPAIIKFKKRLFDLSQLKDGWDDEHAIRIFPEVIGNIESALKAEDDGDLWGKWIAYPDVNGTITLMKKDGTASVSVGTNEYSFFGLRNGQQQSGDNEPFKADSLVEVLKSFS